MRNIAINMCEKFNLRSADKQQSFREWKIW